MRQSKIYLIFFIFTLGFSKLLIRSLYGFYNIRFAEISSQQCAVSIPIVYDAIGTSICTHRHADGRAKTIGPSRTIILLKSNDSTEKTEAFARNIIVV